MKFISDIKNIVLIITIPIIIVLNIYIFYAPLETIDIRISTVLNFILTFLFAWILTEKNVEKTYEEKNKLPAIRSYRQTKSISDNIKYLIKKIENLLDNNIDKDMINYLTNIRDFLVYLLSHTDNIKQDWGDIIKDISLLNELEKIDEQIRAFSSFTDKQKEKIEHLIKKREEVKQKLPEYLRSDFDSELVNIDEKGNKGYLFTGSSSVKYRIEITVDKDFDANNFAENLNKERKDATIYVGFKDINIKEQGANKYLILVTAVGDTSGNVECVKDVFLSIEGVVSVKIIDSLDLTMYSYS